MKIYSIIVLAFLFIMTSCNKKIDIDPTKVLSTEQIKEKKYQLARYYAGLAKKSTHQDKFDAKYDEHYQEEAKRYELLYFYKDPETQYEYFALTRIAPSMQLKKVATVGKVLFDGNKIVSYEEKFRTWKMPEEELKEKTKEMFERYIKGEDLSKYETINTNPEFWIEFPDENTYYDTTLQMWKHK